MAHPQAVALAELCPHEIRHQQRVASRPPSACVASRVVQGATGPSSSCVWNPRVFPDTARGCQCRLGVCLHPQGCLRRGVRASFNNTTLTLTVIQWLIPGHFYWGSPAHCSRYNGHLS